MMLARCAPQQRSARSRLAGCSRKKAESSGSCSSVMAAPLANYHALSAGGTKAITRTAVGVLAVQVAGSALGYAMQVVLARWMSAENYGMYTYAIAWATP